MKSCHDCNKSEPEVEFTPSRKYICKNCVRIRNRKYNEKQGCEARIIPKVTDTHKECCKCRELKPLKDYTSTSRGRKGKASYCKPCMSKYQLKYTSKEERRINTQRYRNENRNRWRSLHRLNQYKRRSNIEAQSDGTITDQFLKEIYETEECYYCQDFIDKENRTLEHKQPLNKQGKHSVNNIVMCCNKCNSTKRDMTESEFLTYLKKQYD